MKARTHINFELPHLLQILYPEAKYSGVIHEPQSRPLYPSAQVPNKFL